MPTSQKSICKTYLQTNYMYKILSAFQYLSTTYFLNKVLSTKSTKATENVIHQFKKNDTKKPFWFATCQGYSCMWQQYLKLLLKSKHFNPHHNTIYVLFVKVDKTNFDLECFLQHERIVNKEAESLLLDLKNSYVDCFDFAKWIHNVWSCTYLSKTTSKHLVHKTVTTLKIWPQFNKSPTTLHFCIKSPFYFSIITPLIIFSTTDVNILSLCYRLPALFCTDCENA